MLIVSFPHLGHWNRVRVNRNFLKRFKLIWGVQIGAQKYSCFFLSEETSIVAHPLPQEGRSRSSRTWERDAMDAAWSGAFCARRPAMQRTAKACGPDPATLGPSFAGAERPREARVAREPVHPGATVFFHAPYFLT